MEDLENAALKAAKKAGYNPDNIVDIPSIVYYKDAFKKGAEWQKAQSTWITVADQEPEEFKNVLLSAGSLPSVFVGYFNGEDFVVGNTGEIVEYFRVMHWMEIPA